MEYKLQRRLKKILHSSHWKDHSNGRIWHNNTWDSCYEVFLQAYEASTAKYNRNLILFSPTLWSAYNTISGDRESRNHYLQFLMH